jgi:hypothetical protein
MRDVVVGNDRPTRRRVGGRPPRLGCTQAGGLGGSVALPHTDHEAGRVRPSPRLPRPSATGAAQYERGNPSTRSAM